LTAQQASKDVAKEREAAEKARRLKEAQEKRERERHEKIARTNALVDINGGMSDFVILSPNMSQGLIKSLGVSFLFFGF